MVFAGLGLVGAFVIAVHTLVLCIGAQRATRKLGKLDAFKHMLKSPNGEPRATLQGALCTVVLIPVIILFAGAILLSFVMDNTAESKAIVPNIVAKNIIADYHNATKEEGEDRRRLMVQAEDTRVPFNMVA